MRQSNAKFEKRQSCWQCTKVVLHKYVRVKGCRAKRVIALWTSWNGKFWILLIGKLLRDTKATISDFCKFCRANR